MSVSNLTAYPYEIHTITTTVVDNKYQYITGGNVTFKFNDTIIGYANVINGKARINYTTPIVSPGNYTITVFYNSSNNYTTSNTTGYLNILNYNTITHVKSVSSYNDALTLFKAIIKTNTNAFVKNGTVTFKINTKTIGTVTISKGIALLNYTIPTYWTSKNYTITAIYNGAIGYNQSTGKDTLKIISNKVNTTVNIQINNSTIYPYQNYQFIATIQDNNTNYLNKGTVTFKINNKYITTINVTNERAILNYTLPELNTNKYIITAVYNGFSSYKSSQINKTIPISQYSTVTNVSSVIAAYKHTTIFTAMIKTTEGQIVKTGTVTFKINGTTIGTANVTEGHAKIIYLIPSSWAYKGYTIKAEYNQTTAYKSSYSNASLMVGELFTYSNIKTSAKNLIKYINKYNEMPNYIAVKGEDNKVLVSKTEFLYLMTRSLINNGNVASYIIYNPAITTNDNFNNKTILNKSDYIGIAGIINNYVQDNKVIPNNITTSTGKMSLNSLIYMYSAILYYDLNYSSLPSTTKLISEASLKGTNNSYTVPSTYSKYLVATTNCQASSTTIKNLAKKITSGIVGTYNQALAIFSYLNDKTDYIYYSNTRYGAIKTWNTKYGNCVDLAHIVVAVMRAAGIPARYVHGYCTFTSGLQVGHVWSEVYVNGKWYTCDSSSNRNVFGVINNWYKTVIYNRYITLPF